MSSKIDLTLITLDNSHIEQAQTNKVQLHQNTYNQLTADDVKPVLNIKGQFFTPDVLPTFKFQNDNNIAMQLQQRSTCSLTKDADISAEIFDFDRFRPLVNINVELNVASKKAGKIEISTEKLDEIFLEIFKNQIMTCKQKFAIKTDMSEVPLTATVLSVETDMFLPRNKHLPQYDQENSGVIIKSNVITTTVNWTTVSQNLRIKADQHAQKDLFKTNFNFEELGIGGLDNEFKNIFRRVFTSRIQPHSVLEKLGIEHIKGMLLQGPPGCGKTLIARQISKTLIAKEPKIIAGPDIFDKQVGGSEGNIRALFTDAEADYKMQGDDSELHIIVIDEIDALCKNRGSTRDNTGVSDNVVNQLLSKIDGVESLNNILLIGMTNRKDLIDDAVLRPGRLEIHVYIGLPDEIGRNQVLKIHTAKMKENKCLDSSFSLEQFSKKMKNFTGAEIASVVKCASNTALTKKLDMQNLTKKIDSTDIIVKVEDFEQAVSEIKPAFGVDEEMLTKQININQLRQGQSLDNIQEKCEKLIAQVTKGDTKLISILLSGESGVGKTSIAAHLAEKSGCTFIKFISSEAMIGNSTQQKIEKIHSIFEDAYKAKLSCIILDDIERIIEYISLGPRFSNEILQALLILIKKINSADGRKMLIIGTTSLKRRLKDLELVKSFTVDMEVKAIDSEDEIKRIIKNIDDDCDESELNEIGTNIINQQDEISIKELMLSGQMTLQDNGKITQNGFMNSLSAIKY